MSCDGVGWKRAWRMLIGSVAASVVGDLLSTVGIATYLLQQRSAAWVAAYFLTALSVRTISAPLWGRVVDRHPDVSILVMAADLVRAGLFVLAAFVVSLDSPSVLLVVTTAAAAFGGLHRPAFASFVPRIVPDAQLESANGSVAATHQVGWVVGPAIGSLVALWWDVRVALLVNAATFVAALLLTSGIRAAVGSTIRDDPTGRGRLDPEPDEAGERGRSRIAATVRRDLAVPLLASCGLMIVFGAENVVHPLIARDAWHLNPSVAGILVTSAGTGGLVGAPIAVRVARRLGPRRGLFISVAATLATFIGLAVAPNLGWGLALCCIGGAVGLLYDVSASTFVQRSVPSDSLGRAFGLLEGIDGAAQLIGVALAPIAFGLVGVHRTVLTLGGVGLMLLLAAATIGREAAISIDLTTLRGGEQHEQQDQPCGTPAHQVVAERS